MQVSLYLIINGSYIQVVLMSYLTHVLHYNPILLVVLMDRWSLTVVSGVYWQVFLIQRWSITHVLLYLIINGDSHGFNQVCRYNHCSLSSIKAGSLYFRSGSIISPEQVSVAEQRGAIYVFRIHQFISHLRISMNDVTVVITVKSSFTWIEPFCACKSQKSWGA